MWNFLKRYNLLKTFKKETEEPELHDHPWAMAVPAGSAPIGALANMPPGSITTAKPTVGSRSIAPAVDGMLSISSPADVGSLVIEANGKTIMEAWDSKEAMVGRDQEVGNRPIGALGFADGIAYIMTRGGWVNMGEALEKPLEMTNRRGAIKAQKERKQNGTR